MFGVLGLGTGIKCLGAGGVFCYSVHVYVLGVGCFFYCCLGTFFLRGSFTVAFLDQLSSLL